MSDALAQHFESIATKVAAMTPHELRAWHASLEAERTDTSWMQFRTKHEPITPVVIQRVPRPATLRNQRTRDRIMFHAGRHAEGARDAEAIEAAKKVKKYIDQTKKGI